MTDPVGFGNTKMLPSDCYPFRAMIFIHLLAVFLDLVGSVADDDTSRSSATAAELIIILDIVVGCFGTFYGSRKYI